GVWKLTPRVTPLPPSQVDATGQADRALLRCAPRSRRESLDKRARAFGSLQEGPESLQYTSRIDVLDRELALPDGPAVREHFLERRLVFERTDHLFEPVR